jgi:integrase
MSLYKRQYSQFWWFQIWKPDGKRIRMSSGTADKEKAAIIEQTFIMAYGKKTPQQKLFAMLEAVCGSDNTGIPLIEIWPTYTRWVATTGKELVHATLQARSSTLHRFITWTKINWPTAKTTNDITRTVAAAYASYLAAMNIKATTRKNNIGDLGTIWSTLARVTDDVKNPWPLVLPEAKDSTRGKAYSREQETAIYEAAEKIGKDWKLACIIARHTGLRYSSVARLTWDEVDFETNVIRHVPPKTKRHDIQVVLPMSTPLKNALKEARAQRMQSENVLPIHAAVYPWNRKQGGPGAYSVVLQKAGLQGKGFTFHSWRHTFRTRLSEAKVSSELAKKLGGWTVDKTAERYDHAERVEELRAAVEAASGQWKESPVALSTAETGTS